MIDAFILLEYQRMGGKSCSNYSVISRYIGPNTSLEAFGANTDILFVLISSTIVDGPTKRNSCLNKAIRHDQ